MNPFQTFARYRTRQVFPSSWRILALLGLGLVIFMGGLGLILQLPFQEALMVPGIIRSEPAGQVIRSPFSGRLDQVFIRSWGQVEKGELLARLNQEELELEISQLQESLDQLVQEQTMYAILSQTITQGGPNPFRTEYESHGYQLYTHFFQEHQLLALAVQAKHFEMVQYQSLPLAMQKQAILSGLIGELEALDRRVQSYIESFLLQISQRILVLKENQRELNQMIQRVSLQQQSLNLIAELPGQVILLGSLSPGDWVVQGQSLFLVLPDQPGEIYLELQIPQHQRSRMIQPSQIRFFSQDGNPRSNSLVVSELTHISDQPISLSMGGVDTPGFLARGALNHEQHPWLIPGTTGVGWIQGTSLTLANWILELLDLRFNQSSWWQRLRDQNQSRYSNPQKQRLTSQFWTVSNRLRS
jgi:multidrug efflux pump subunit AcrA (membrane-fusion protein)